MKSNPNVKSGLGQQTGRTRNVQAEFSSKTDPEYGRTPLTDDQKDLATRYLSLARALAKQLHARRRVEREEIESVAFVALVEAARCYDPTGGALFPTFARYRIVGAILDFSRKAGKNRHLQSSTMNSPWGVEMEAEFYGTPVGITPDLPVGAELDALDSVESHLRPMSPAQARACRLIYLEGKNQDEIAEIMDCTPSYVSKLHREAIGILFERFRGQSGIQPASRDSRVKETNTRGRDAWCRPEPMRARVRMPRPQPLAAAC